MKLFTSVTTSAPVVTTTLRAPVAADESMFNTTAALVAEFTVSDATVIPAPKLAVVVPCTKCVNCPVTVTERLCCPCCPEFGETWVRAGKPRTLNPPLKDAVSVSYTHLTLPTILRV